MTGKVPQGEQRQNHQQVGRGGAGSDMDAGKPEMVQKQYQQGEQNGGHDCFAQLLADFVGKANFIEDETSCFIVRPEWINLKKSDSKNSENKIISKTFLGSTIRYKIGTNKTKNGILIVDKSSNDSEVFNPGDYVKINILQNWKRLIAV